MYRILVSGLLWAHGHAIAQVPSTFGAFKPYDKPIAFVQASPLASSASTASLTSTFASLPAAQNTVIVFINGWKATTFDYPAGSITDNKGNTYTQACKKAGTVTGGYAISTIFYAKNISTSAGSFIVTATPSASSEIALRAIEWTGLDLLNPLDVTANNASTISTTTQDSGTTAATNYADEVVAAVIGNNTGAVTTNTNGFTDRGTISSGTNPVGQFADKVVTAKGTQSATWSTSQPVDWKACIATFR